MAVALGCAARVLAYLTELPDLAGADALVHVLLRRMVASNPERGSSRQCGYAARDVRHSASLAGRVADEGGVEGQDAFMTRLRREHGRKYSFWQPLQEEWCRETDAAPML